MVYTKESTDFFSTLKKSLSETRFAGYQTKEGNDLDSLSKYLWNIGLCESLCPCFQLLEVACRNRVHAEIATAIQDSTWILNENRVFYPEEQEAIKKAKESLRISGAALTEDYLIAEMKFGFWTALLNARYDRLWHKIIRDVFPNMPKASRTRGDASVLMNGVRRLRNAALHHHSIWHWRDLKDRHSQMRSMIKYICRPSDLIAQEIDRFPNAYSAGMAECQKAASKILTSVQMTNPA